MGQIIQPGSTINGPVIQTDGTAPTGGVGQTMTGVPVVPGTGLDGPNITFGMASRRQTGPLDVGFPDGQDKHLLGWDADGHAINSLHLSTNTLWIGDSVNDEARNSGRAGASYACCPGGDAPMEFSCWKEPEEGIYPVPVRLGYDPESQHQWCGGPKPGLWRWWAMCNYYVAQPQGQQTGPGSTRAGSPCGIQGTRGSQVRPRQPYNGFEPFVATVVQTAGPVDLGRPNIIRPGYADLRTNTSPDAQSLLAADLYTPITSRMESYGAQGGACSGSVLGDNTGYAGEWIPGETWNYTELPGQGRFQGGTASGGIVLMPPEVDMADIDEGLAPSGRILSNTFMIAAPNARFGAGLPNLANGAMDDGYSWFVEDGKLVFNRHVGDCPGLGVGVFELNTDGALVTLDSWSIQAKKAPDDVTGFQLDITAGKGGDASLAVGKSGGMLLLDGGAGSVGTGALAAGVGALARFRGGNAGTDNGGGGAVGGAALVAGGVASGANSGGAAQVRGGSGTPNGNVVIGDAITSEVRIGASAIPTTVFGDLLFSGEGSGLLFGEIYVQDNATETVIATAGKANKVQVTVFDTNGESNGVTPDHTNGHLTVVTEGKYFCHVHITVDSIAGAASKLGASLWKNNGATEFSNVHVHRDLGGGGSETGSADMAGFVDLAVGDTIEVWTWNETNTQNYIFSDITLSLLAAGGT